MRTTAAHFRLFERTALAVAKSLGLTDWELRFAHEENEGGALAYVTYNVPNRIATLWLNRTWKVDAPTAKLLRMVAKHEVLHVLLADMAELAYARSSTREAFDQAEHAAIRRLEKIL